ncbi:hypothetical protein DPEC_G00259460 [Dallia pectoralis]|uniref:Uncharacterized protein n=1 Tax=Dallia pectoralis TaxID=75939 RepID=A0ACC2FRH6_DALPE|nr:hypothetical protein DPEC_G00259460 [Dallia pectoralis]
MVSLSSPPFLINVPVDCSSSVSVYTTYCGLTSCTVLLVPCWFLGFEERRGVEGGEDTGVEGTGLASQVPQKPPPRTRAGFADPSLSSQMSLTPVPVQSGIPDLKLLPPLWPEWLNEGFRQRDRRKKSKGFPWRGGYRSSSQHHLLSRSSRLLIPPRTRLCHLSPMRTSPPFGF